MPLTLISVRHKLGSYSIQFTKLAEVWKSLPGPLYVLTDRNVASAWGKSIPPAAQVKIVDPGEASKSMGVYDSCLQWLVEAGADRGVTLVALGGGVIGDLGGFVASSYMRGIRYVQIPSTLLAQVDSSVGGKVAIDLPQGKNLVGAFYPPSEVYICPELLATLSWREFTNGLAEVWKYGFILDAELVLALRHMRLTSQSSLLESVIRRCVQLKADIVQRDELDISGLRAVLNFGHTVGHAIEKLSHYEGPLHGEAVAIGMVAEAKLGERLGVSAKGLTEEIESCLKLDGLPTRHELLQSPNLVEAMLSDKKTESGQLAFSLVTRVGECKLVRAVPRLEVEAALCAL